MEKDDFLKKLEKLVEHAKSKHNTLDAGEINDFFTGDNLSPEQMDSISALRFFWVGTYAYSW